MKMQRSKKEKKNKLISSSSFFFGVIYHNQIFVLFVLTNATALLLKLDSFFDGSVGQEEQSTDRLSNRFCLRKKHNC
jgi:hypothetical protein